MGSQRFRGITAAGPRDSAVIMVPFDPDEAWGAKASSVTSQPRPLPTCSAKLKGWLPG